jgi:hypothetical protein
MKNKIIVLLDKKDKYVLDVEAAKKAGVLNKEKKPIISFEVGDVFFCRGDPGTYSEHTIAIFRVPNISSSEALYSFTGVNNDVFRWYSNKPKFYGEVIEHLNKYNYIKIGSLKHEMNSMQTRLERFINNNKKWTM